MLTNRVEVTGRRDRLPDLGEYVARAAAQGRLVVQPRMGLPEPQQMTAGLWAVAAAGPSVAGTITLDSYTRVGDHVSARKALDEGQPLNGFPLVAHGAPVTAQVTAGLPVPVQVRHGSADPGEIFRTMARAGLSASEGGPVSYCLPYGRTPLAESVAAWRDASAQLADRCRAQGTRAHLETFGGCLLGQLCPPSLLIAMSVLEALFFVQQGVESVSLSYAQQTHPVQDIEALAALRVLAHELLPSRVDWHLVLYTFMGVFPRTAEGAKQLLDTSADIAVRGGAERLIVKTVAEAHRIPTVAENLTALHTADARAQRARSASQLPAAHQVDAQVSLAEARALIEPVLEHGDIGEGLLAAFRDGYLDVPFCLHADNRGLTQGFIDPEGRLGWAQTGRLPLPRASAWRGRLSSGELLTMLYFNADRHDECAVQLATEIPALTAPHPYRVAVIGAGPRGLAVLERLTARLTVQPAGRPVELYAIDAVQPGSGRIWRTDQADSLLMNTPAGEVTMFSGPRDVGPTRPGAGPSLAEWWQIFDPDNASASGYAPRVVYGKYLQFVLAALENALPEGVILHRVRARVERLCRPGHAAGWLLTLDDGRVIGADQAVLATGHPLPALSPQQQDLADFAAGQPGLIYVRGDSAADMPLDQVQPGAAVGILGAGLACYDVISQLTEGRGGVFKPLQDGAALRYVPSGREPRLIAGSRSGVPVPARGRNQKAPDHRYPARIFTRERVEQLRSGGKLDFMQQLLPWLMAEVNLVYYATEITNRLGTDVAELFTEQAVRAAVRDPRPDLAVVREADRFGAGDLAPVDLQRMARPLSGQRFSTRAACQRAVAEVIRLDLEQAEKGNLRGPLKAALDTFRDVRSNIQVAVDLSGLTARSHEEDFLGSFVPLISHLSAGPPTVRQHQILALMDANVLEFVGPGARFDRDPRRGCFVASSSQVAEGPVDLDALIDARIPAPDIRADNSKLIRALVEQGIVCSYANVDDDAVFDTGGMAVTDSPFHPIDVRGRAVTDLYALGIPTEHARWFTQVGSSRPGAWGGFMTDADEIARHLLAAARMEVAVA